MKIISDPATGVVLGGSIVGRTAAELISVIAVAVTNNLRVVDIVDSLLVHPAMAESLIDAAVVAGRPSGQPTRSGVDLAAEDGDRGPGEGHAVAVEAAVQGAAPGRRLVRDELLAPKLRGPVRGERECTEPVTPVLVDADAGRIRATRCRRRRGPNGR